MQFCSFLAVLDIDTLGTFNVSKTVYNKFFKVLMIKWIINLIDYFSAQDYSESCRVCSVGMIWVRISNSRWIIPHQRNHRILPGKGFIGSFDVPVISDHWSWSGSSQRKLRTYTQFLVFFVCTEEWWWKHHQHYCYASLQWNSFPGVWLNFFG